jgi:outer membrane immunogenic protein
MRLAVIPVAILGLTAASLAQAADLPTKAPPMIAAPLAYNWSGFYVGGHLGFGWLDNDSVAVTATPSFPANFAFTRQSDSGFLGGGQIGFNWQAGQWVFGLEGDLSWTDISACSRSLSPTVAGTFADGCLGVNWTATVGPRLGFAWSNVLLYVKGGLAWADFTSTSTTTNAAGVVTSITTGGETRTGLMLGGGLEYGLANNWSIKIEYNWMDFGTDTVNRSSLATATGVVTPLQRLNDTQIQEVKFGLNYRFNWGAPIVARY